MSDPTEHHEANAIYTIDERFRQLCEKAAKEQDRDKLLKLVQEIITYPAKKIKFKEKARS